MTVKYAVVVAYFFCVLQLTIQQRSKSDKSKHFDTCVGQCSFEFVETLKTKIGNAETTGLMQLEFSAILRAFSNSTFFEGFCRIYSDFRTCHNACPLSYLRELLRKGAEVVDLYCVKNYDAILEKLGCLKKIDEEMSKQCLKSCTSYHDGVTALLRNFNRLALDGDSTQAETDLGQSCEYVICSLHCDAPSIAYTCGYDTAQLAINLTKETFEKVEAIAIGTGAIAKWPAQCTDISNYSIPTPPPLPGRDSHGTTTEHMDLDEESNSEAPSHQKQTRTTGSASSIRSHFSTFASFAILSVIFLYVP